MLQSFFDSRRDLQTSKRRNSRGEEQFTAVRGFFLFVFFPDSPRRKVWIFAGDGKPQLDADTVDQLYRLTKFRHELTLDTKPTPKWSEEEFERATKLMKMISERSSQVRRNASVVAHFAEDLALLDPSSFDV